MQTIYVIIGIIYSTIGIASGLYALIKHFKDKVKEDNLISQQIININKTLKNHEIEDKEIRESIKNIEKEQENQNIKIAKIHTKVDLICKASNVNNEKEYDENKTHERLKTR